MISSALQYFVYYPKPFLVDTTHLTKTLTSVWVRKLCVLAQAYPCLPACTHVILVIGSVICNILNMSKLISQVSSSRISS